MDTPSSDNDLFMLDNDLPPYSKEPQLSLSEAAMENENFGELASTFSEVELEYLNVLHDLDSSRSIKPLSDAIFMIKDPRESAKLPEEMEAISSDDGESISEVECLRIKNQMKTSKSKNVAENKVPEKNPAQSCSRRQSPRVLGTPEYSLRKRNCKITLARYDKSKRKKLQTAKPPKRLQPKRGKTIAPAQAQSPIQMEENDNREPEKVQADADSPQTEIANVRVKAKTPAQKKKKMGRLASSEKRNTVRGRPGINDKILSNADLNGITSANQLIRQHSNGKYQCTFCRRNFPNRANLIIHLRIHTGERPYECKQCNESFKQLNHVQQHSKNVHQREIGKDDVTFTPGRLEVLLLNPNRKLGRPVQYGTVTSKRISSSSSIKKTSIPIPKPSTPPLLELDPKLLEVINNDENESEEELIASKELKNYIDETNLQNSFHRPQFFRMNQGDKNKSVEVDANLLMYFIRPFFHKSGVNCPEDLLEVHSDLRRMLAIPDEKEDKTQKEVKTETVKSNDAKLPIRKKKLKPLLNPKKILKSASALVSCKHCDMKFTTIHHLRKHMSRVHVSLKCGECAMNFQYKGRLRTHMATHTSSENADGNNEFHFCSNCKLAYASAEKLQIHVKARNTHPIINKISTEEEEKNPVKPKTAKEKVKKTGVKNKSGTQCSGNLLRAHLNLGNTSGIPNERNPKNEIKNENKDNDNCDKSNDKLINSKLGSKRKIKIAPSTSLHSCKNCGMKFARKFHLRNHVSENHGNFKCGECVKSFQQRQSLSAHMISNHNSGNADGANEFHFCKICKLAYASAEGLQIHVQSHDLKPKVVVPTSKINGEKKKVPKSKSKVKKREEKDTEGNPPVPTQKKKIPKKEFEVPLEKLSSIKQTVSRKPSNGDTKKARPLVKKRMTCATCGDQFHGRDKLEEHMKSHGNVRARSHICTECGKGFFDTHTLKQHMQTHSVAKFECKLCGARLGRQASLTIHLLRHTGEFKFECKHCAKKFVDRGNYVRHLAVHEGKELMKCPCCDASFANKQGYHVHMKDIHPEVYRKQKKEKVPSASATSTSVPVPPAT